MHNGSSWVPVAKPGLSDDLLAAAGGNITGTDPEDSRTIPGLATAKSVLITLCNNNALGSNFNTQEVSRSHINSQSIIRLNHSTANDNLGRISVRFSGDVISPLSGATGSNFICAVQIET